MSISVVIPMTEKHDFTLRCVERVTNLSEGRADITVVNNGSSAAYTPIAKENVIELSESCGVFPALLAGVRAAKNDVVLTMHNDVLIHEHNFDLRILREFKDDTKLGIAGFFGGRGVAHDGGRIHPESNMQGIEWGQHAKVHGSVLQGTHPAVVFDSLALIVNRPILNSVFTDAELNEMPPHHWFDRVLTLGIVMARYHALTIGIAFDHYGGATSCSVPAFRRATEKWVKDKGLPETDNPDYVMYEFGKKQFQERWMGLFPVIVDRRFNLHSG